MHRVHEEISGSRNLLDSSDKKRAPGTRDEGLTSFACYACRMTEPQQQWPYGVVTTIEPNVPDGFVSLPLIGKGRDEIHVNVDDVVKYGPEDERIGNGCTEGFLERCTPLRIRGETELVIVRLPIREVVRLIVAAQRQRKTVQR